mgnify:CR=1 FL=1
MGVIFTNTRKEPLITLENHAHHQNRHMTRKRLDSFTYTGRKTFEERYNIKT